MASSFRKPDTAALLSRLERLEQQTPRALTAVFSAQASQSEAYMKGTAPWHDDTGAARTGLRARAEKRGEQFYMLLAHSVKYGIFLEVCNNRKYAIILPSLRYTMGQLKGKIRGMWGRL